MLGRRAATLLATMGPDICGITTSVSSKWIAPRLKAVDLEWVNFQVMRRTHASFMRELKVDPKIVALENVLEQSDSPESPSRMI